jgi:hypothetical protein
MNPLRRRRKSSRGTGIGVVDEALDVAGLDAALDALGVDGLLARTLDEAVAASIGGVTALSPLTSSLAVTYLERIQGPISAMSLASGVFLTTRAYVAHQAVEADPGAYGARDIPVLGSLPPLHHGQVPRDLLVRVVKATRRHFAAVRALDEGVWDGFVLCSTWRVHDQSDIGSAVGDDGEPLEDPGYLEASVVDGLTRFGWILRQVDIHYGLGPEDGPPPGDPPSRSVAD